MRQSAIGSFLRALGAEGPASNSSLSSIGRFRGAHIEANAAGTSAPLEAAKPQSLFQVRGALTRKKWAHVTCR